MLVIENCAVATVDAAGTEYATGHVVVDGDHHRCGGQVASLGISEELDRLKSKSKLRFLDEVVSLVGFNHDGLVVFGNPDGQINGSEHGAVAAHAVCPVNGDMVDQSGVCAGGALDAID